MEMVLKNVDLLDSLVRHAITLMCLHTILQGGDITCYLPNFHLA